MCGGVALCLSSLVFLSLDKNGHIEAKSREREEEEEEEEEREKQLLIICILWSVYIYHLPLNHIYALSYHVIDNSQCEEREGEEERREEEERRKYDNAALQTRRRRRAAIRSLLTFTPPSLSISLSARHQCIPRKRLSAKEEENGGEEEEENRPRITQYKKKKPHIEGKKLYCRIIVSVPPLAACSVPHGEKHISPSCNIILASICEKKEKNGKERKEERKEKKKKEKKAYLSLSITYMLKRKKGRKEENYLYTMYERKICLSSLQRKENCIILSLISAAEENMAAIIYHGNFHLLYLAHHIISVKSNKNNAALQYRFSTLPRM